MLGQLDVVASEGWNLEYILLGIVIHLDFVFGHE